MSSNDDDGGEAMGGDEAREMLVAFRRHKDAYYTEKMHIEPVNKCTCRHFEFLLRTLRVINSDVCRAVLNNQTREYLLALQWILHYYFNGVQSWSWFYPQHYAPYVSDLRNLSDLDLQFDLSKPFMPFEQLMAVLPSASKTLLPEAYQVSLQSFTAI